MTPDVQAATADTLRIIAGLLGSVALCIILALCMTAHACSLDRTAACMEDGSRAEYVRCVSR